MWGAGAVRGRSCLPAARYARFAGLERQEALASVRAEGLELSPEGLEVLAAVADGRLSGDEARAPFWLATGVDRYLWPRGILSRSHLWRVA